MVSKVTNNGLNDVGLMTQTVVVRLLGVRKNMGDQLCLICMSKMLKYGDDFWTPVLMASYWLQVVTRPPRLPEDSAWLFPHGSASQSVGVIAHFAWQFLSTASNFGVPMVLLTMSFWDEPKYFPQLR